MYQPCNAPMTGSRRQGGDSDADRRAGPDTGNNARMRELYHQHSGPLLHFLTGLSGGDWMLAEDLSQETMMRAWRHLASIPADSDATRRWLLTVGRRIAIDAHRRRDVRPAEVRLVEQSRPASVDPIGGALAARDLVAAFRRLTPSQREVLSEIYFHGRPTHEVAKRLAVPPGTVRSRAHYALRTLRAAVESDRD
jgi:RNA polymerase sigma-70 factor, ECF subfamily